MKTTSVTATGATHMENCELTAFPANMIAKPNAGNQETFRKGERVVRLRLRWACGRSGDGKRGLCENSGIITTS
jgi:hypothetical protein